MRSFGKYELHERIGTGGMAEVFLGRATGPVGFEKRVAIKRLLPALAHDPEVVSMFLDEARLAARFVHPNIVQVYELGEADGGYYMVMELVTGVSLAELHDAAVANAVEWPSSHRLQIMSHVCDALYYAHTFVDTDGTPLRVVHRDISPGNIMLSHDGVVKLLDFGIARAVSNLYRTRTLALRGKEAYMAPEYISGAVRLDHRADIFSLGVVLYELLTGSLPFEGDTPTAYMDAILEAPAPDPRSVAPEVPAAVAALIMQALEKDRRHRPQSAREVKQRLDAVLASTGGAVEAATLAETVGELLGKPAEQLHGGEASPRERTVRLTLGLGVEATDADSTVITSSPTVVEPTVRAMVSARRRARPSRRVRGLALATLLSASVAAGAVLLRTEAEPALAVGTVAAPMRPASPVVEPPGDEAYAAPSAPDEIADEPPSSTATSSPAAPASERAAPDTVARKPPVRAPARGSGSLMVDTRPWTHVKIDGELVDTTPISTPIELPSGTHTLELSNPDAGISHRETVNVLPGRVVVVRKKFEQGTLRLVGSWSGGARVDGRPFAAEELHEGIALYEGWHVVEAACTADAPLRKQRVRVRAGALHTTELDCDR